MFARMRANMRQLFRNVDNYVPFGIRRLVDGKVRSEILKEILDLVLLSSAKSENDWWHEGGASQALPLWQASAYEYKATFGDV
jgi:hypothetical protein